MSSYKLVLTAIQVIFYVLLTDWWYTLICSSTTRFLHWWLTVFSHRTNLKFMFSLWYLAPPSTSSYAVATDSMIGQQHTDALYPSTIFITHHSLLYIISIHCDLFLLIWASCCIGYPGEDSLNGYWWSWLTTSHPCTCTNVYTIAHTYYVNVVIASRCC